MTEPLKIENRKIPNSQFKCVDLSGTVFEDVNLSGCTFRNVNLGKCDFHDISFANAMISGSCFEGCEIPHGPFDDLKIAGVRVRDLLQAYKKVHGELPKTPHPERKTWGHH